MPYWVYWVSDTEENPVPRVLRAPLSRGSKAWYRRVELVGTFVNDKLVYQLMRRMTRYYYLGVLRRRLGFSREKKWATFWAASPAERDQLVQDGWIRCRVMWNRPLQLRLF